MSESPEAIPWGGEEAVCGMRKLSYFRPKYVIFPQLNFRQLNHFSQQKMIKRHTQIQTLVPEKPIPFPTSDQKGKNHTLSGRAEHTQIAFIPWGNWRIKQQTT